MEDTSSGIMWSQELGAESIVRDPLLFTENYASTFSFQCYSIVFFPLFFFLFSNPIPRDRNTTFHPFSIISIEQDGISNSIVRRHSLHLIGINLSYKSPPIFLFVLNILSTCEGKSSVFFLLFFSSSFTIHRIWIFKADREEEGNFGCSFSSRE